MGKEVELILQYVGDLTRVQEQVGFSSVTLLGGYAVIRIQPERIAMLLEYPEIVYTEIPRQLFFTIEEGKVVSCINELQSIETSDPALNGSGVLVAVIDSGIDYFHPEFRKEDGSTRIVALWDQTISPGNGGIGQPFQEGVPLGYVYGEEEINQALRARDRREGLQLVPSQDLSGHGTHVTGIAAGSGQTIGGRLQGRGVAYESELVIVKLGRTAGDIYPQTASLMEAVDFSLRTAIDRFQPVAINLSFGNNDGAHNGRSILETYLAAAAGIWRNSIVIGTGNEGTTGRHRGGQINGIEEVELAISETEEQMECWLWKNYQDRFELELITPGGESTGNLLTEEREWDFSRVEEFRLSSNKIQVFWQGPTPYNPLQLIRFQWIGEQGGNWRFRMTPEKIVTGEYDIWLTGNLVSPETRFLQPTETRTLTIPSTAEPTISVGAYDARTGAPAFFSGRGYSRNGNPMGGTIKPDLIAPGVDVLSASPGDSYAVRSGTSMATPFVTGTAALFLQWGIVLENDRNLFGQRLKAFLVRGASREEGRSYPSEVEGWGKLCAVDSLPV